MHTNHCLRPPRGLVLAYLANPSDDAWTVFRSAYLDVLGRRMEADSVPFDKLAALARHNDVYLGCSCPTKANPRVEHCHTVVALGFMRSHYEITIQYPD